MSLKLVGDIYRLAWPVLIAQLAVMTYAVIDTIMAGQFATADLAAVGIGASIYFSVFVALMGVLLAVSPTVSQLLGAKRYDEIGEQVRQAMWLALGLALLSVLVYRYPEPLLAMSQTSPDVASKVRSYLAIAAWGAPAGLAFRLFASYTTAVSLPRVMMALNLLGLTLKVPLNWMLVFGHAGSPAMGAAGCALSTTIVNWIICILAWVWCASSAQYKSHHVFSRWSWPRWIDQRRLVALGIPIGMTFLVDVTAFTFMALFIARLGAVNSAAHQIAANVAAVMYMLPLAMGNAVGVLVGQAIGGRKFALARSTGITGIALSVALAAASGGLLVAGSEAVAAFYSSDSAVREVATTLLIFVAGYHVFDALQAVTVSALRGYKRTVMPLLINIAGLWGVGLLGGYVIALTTRFDLSAIGANVPLGVPGFWVAAIVGMFIAGVGIVLYLLAISAPDRAAIRSGADREHASTAAPSAT
ncbi:MAG: MATE family efflux transporter [Pseudomonadota bacterium]|nr:MATE family efflux transporter [Pseudomonadota bacterium]